MADKKFLTEDHVRKVCQPGTEKCCAYFIMDADGPDCAKTGDPGTLDYIDQRLRAGTMRATGDNCEGRYKAKP